MRVYLTPDLGIRDRFDTMAVVDHRGLGTAAELNHCACREARISQSAGLFPTLPPPNSIWLRGGDSEHESRFPVEVAEIDTSGGQGVVPGTEWSRWFHGEMRSNLNLSSFYPFLPGRTYRIRVVVQNGCTAGDERTELIETAEADLGLLYRAHVKEAGWLGWVFDGATAGTTAQERRMEAVQIELLLPIGNAQVCYRADLKVAAG